MRPTSTALPTLWTRAPTWLAPCCLPTRRCAQAQQQVRGACGVCVNVEHKAGRRLVWNSLRSQKVTRALLVFPPPRFAAPAPRKADSCDGLLARAGVFQRMPQIGPLVCWMPCSLPLHPRFSQHSWSSLTVAQCQPKETSRTPVQTPSRLLTWRHQSTRCPVTRW